jgi:hypothetical protein
VNFLGYEAIMLAFEANGVIGLRLMKIARGGVEPSHAPLAKATAT